MKRCLFALRGLFASLVLLSCGGATLTPLPVPSMPGWTPAQIAVLHKWAAAAPDDALPVLAITELDRVSAGADRAAIDHAATDLALRLARMHLLGATPSGWHGVDGDARIDLPARLAQALGAPPSGADAGLDHFFAALRPQHPDYAVLRAAYAGEKDPARRATLALNMERWRWLPVSLGQDYILVNAAAFEVSLWRQGRRVGIWPVVVGKVRAGGGPAFVESRITRWPGNFGAFPVLHGGTWRIDWAFDPGKAPAPLQDWAEHSDPLSLYMRDCVARGLVTRADLDRMDTAVVAQVNEAAAFAVASPPRKAESALEHVFA